MTLGNRYILYRCIIRKYIGEAIVKFLKKPILLVGYFFIAVIGYKLGAVITDHKNEKKINVDKFYRVKDYNDVLIRQLQNISDNKSISKRLREIEINSIAIYGQGSMGRMLYDQLKGSNTYVAFFIDKNEETGQSNIENIPVKNIEMIKTAENVDAIIVTPVYDFESIREDIEKNGVNTRIISLEDLVYEAS